MYFRITDIITYSFYFLSKALDKSCDVTIRNISGRITPPDKDGNGLYDFNVKCVWTVVVEQGHVITVRLSDINMNLWYADCVDNLMVICFPPYLQL